MTVTPRVALLLALCALSVLVLPAAVAGLIAVAVLSAAVVDALAVRRRPDVDRDVPLTLSRGVPSRLDARVRRGAAGRPTRVRQPAPADVDVDPREGRDGLDAAVTPRRRGRHELPPVAVRLEGPLGLGAWNHGACGEPSELLVYPDLPAARRLAIAVRQGRFRLAGMLPRGPLGLGTDFDQVRDYLPDDDIRQVNWRATARLGRPMSNQYRVEQDRDVMCLIDSGRLMASPLEGRSRLDAVIDAATAVALVADQVGDRCGALAFDTEVRRHVRPARSGGDRVVRALFDLETRTVESDYELAFRTVAGTKRAFVIVFTDLLEESAARPLVDAMPVLARRHAVAVASVSDTDLESIVRTPPSDVSDVYSAAVALDVLDARARVSRLLSSVGADVIEASPSALGAACVAAYLRAKARARL